MRNNIAYVPQMNQTLVIVGKDDLTHRVWFYTDAGTISAIKQAKLGGLVEAADAEHPNKWLLRVDPRYDFVEVVEWLRFFNTEPEDPEEVDPVQ